MNRLIVGNWKHNPGTLAEALALAQGVVRIEAPENVDVVACPPLPYLSGIRALHPDLPLGVQDVSSQPLGAHTGEVGTAIFKSLDISYAIIGHSERRVLGETDEEIAAKVSAALSAGITPIVCIGEGRTVQELGSDAVRAFLTKQLDAIPDGAGIVIAYEPIWAIGSGIADDPERAGTTAHFIAEYVAPRMQNVRVLYGGSATAENASTFLEQDAIDGLLVGGASLDATKFAGIVHAR